MPSRQPSELPNGKRLLTVAREVPRIFLPLGDPSLTSDPLDARSLMPEPEPIYDSVNYPERTD